MPIVCFLLEPTNEESIWLRRVASEATVPCPDSAYGHSAAVYVGNAPVQIDPAPISQSGSLARYPAEDSRWPQNCRCGYRFRASDLYVVNYYRIYHTPDGRSVTTRQNDAPPGAIWDAPWMVEQDDEWVGADGRSLTVRLPSGDDWMIDAPAANGGCWRRDGVPPCLSVVPSIDSNRYHGWLTNGILSDDLEGRTYE